MRDYTLTTERERDLLYAAKRATDTLSQTYRPFRGEYAMARRLTKKGMLKTAGVSAMPPHVLYVITDLGREELEVSAFLQKSAAA